MFARKLLVASGVVLALAGPAVAQTVYTGTVTRVDQPASVVILSDGRMVRVPGGAVLVNGQSVVLSAVQPGSVVTIQDGQYVVYQNGAYVAVATTASPYEVSGRVVNIDRTDNVLVLDGWRAIALTPDMQVFQDGRQVALDSVRPGGYVTIRSVSPIAFSDRNKKKKEAMTAPAATVVTSAPAPVAYAGTVARIDSNGIVLTDGRLITTSAETVCLVDDRPVALSTLVPGTYAVIYPNGQQALVAPGQAMATAPSTTEISEAPAAAVPDEPIKLQGGLREYESTRQAP